MRENIIGQWFNRLVAIEDDGTRSSKGDIKWLCQCDCGNLYHALGYRLKNGLTKRTAKAVIFHGFYLALNTSLYILCPFSSRSCLSSLLSRSMRAFLFAR